MDRSNSSFQAGENLEDEELNEEEDVQRDEEAAVDSGGSLRYRAQGRLISSYLRRTTHTVVVTPDFSKPVEDNETAPLLSRQTSRRSICRLRRSQSRQGSVGLHGDATVSQAVFMV